MVEPRVEPNGRAQNGIAPLVFSLICLAIPVACTATGQHIDASGPLTEFSAADKPLRASQPTSQSGESSVRDPEVVVNNSLSACVSLSAGSQANANGIVTQIFHLKHHQEIAACGCKSAIAQYTVTAGDGAERETLLSAQLVLRGRDSLELPLLADKRLQGGRVLTLSVQCANPL